MHCSFALGVATCFEEQLTNKRVTAEEAVLIGTVAHSTPGQNEMTASKNRRVRANAALTKACLTLLKTYRSSCTT